MPARKRYQQNPDKQGSGSSSDPLDIGSLPPPPSTNPPIGVPGDYTSSVDISSYTDIFGDPWGGGGRVDRKPNYMEGDELLPANFGPGRIGELQRELAEIGLLPPSARFQYKVWDDTTAGAFHQLLAYANQNGLNWATALNKLKSESGGAYEVDENGNLVPVDPDAAEKLPTHTTAPEDLAPVFRQAVIETLGQGWSEDQINQAVSAYNQIEIARQREAFAAEGTTNNVVSPPSPEAFIMDRAQEADPDRAGAEKGLQYIDQFQQLLGEWNG